MPDICANPLYLQWIREWWDSANASNAKDRLTYKRAWESMKAHPIEFTHPSEAAKLTGIGPKLVERLTERLETFCRDEGLLMPTKPSRKRVRQEIIPAGDQLNEEEPAATSKRTRKTNKGYVPKYRSGAYALLLTLATLPEGQTVGLTKEELKHQAQPLADASFLVAPDPSKFHTAWNGISILESKHLVYTFGRPTKRYALTEEGWTLAKSMKETNTLESLGRTTGPDQVDAPSTDRPSSTTIRPLRLAVIDLDSDNDTEIPEDRGSFETRIQRKFGSRDEFMTIMAKHLVGLDASLDREALDLISEFAQRSTDTRRTTTAQTKNSASLSKARNVPEQTVPIRQRAVDLASTNKDSLAGSKNTDIVSTHPKTAQSSGLSAYEPIIVPPGSFTVELILDSREVRAKTDRNYLQDQFKQAGLMCEQRALQVGDMIWTARIHDPTIINRLEIDDRKVPEVVLDYVVERKRLDDLDSSIKDGRFLEQKFRLKRSGIKNAIYIIEDYGSLQAMEDQQHTRLVTAMAATQIIDGVFVKRTRKLDDTITYLASITRMLKEKYEKKPLHVIPSSVLSPQNHFMLRAPKDRTEDHHYVTYEAQGSLASKSATLTLRDVFLKMLMCTRGITGDKAIEVQKRWPTSKLFREALEALPSQNEKREMVWKIAGNLPGKRKIGKAVSQTLAEIWGAS